ncbi:MAG: asparagine synthase (glutamine-hydrolyzing) [Thermoanaerobaculia bacterium]|nr:asparagine synthase (glutamine-hydrolyzing) [Thermoanaerobaculia bacterium]
MCGIVGIVGTEVPRQRIERMTDLLSHRGPDDRGVWTAPGVALGHRRLSILDLSSAGRQPMSHAGRTLVYNGEIYNFRQLAGDLGQELISSSDTEVLLRLLARDGLACLDRLVGMFAFGLWDDRRRSLWLGRDRLGIKPLYYRQLPPGGIAFASEIEPLLELGRPEIDTSSLRDFFTYKYVPTPKSIYRGIYKLPPGHTLIFRPDDGSKPEIECWWTPEASSALDRPDEALERLESLLAEVVPAHTLADVPYGVFLSGGIDSTTLAANLDRPRTFTLGFDVRSHDEAGDARRVAEHFGACHHEEPAASVDLEEAVERIPVIYGEPFADHGAWPVYMISRAARRQVKVALAGEGGDELFAGYHWYDKWPRFRSTPLNRLLARWVPPLTASGRSLQRRAATGLERYAMFLGPFTLAQKRAFLSPDLMADDYDDLWHFRRFWRQDLPALKRLQWADIHTYLVDDMLTKLDRASMAVSLEARPPLLDHRLVEFALALDPTLLRDERQGKLLLRRHLAPRVPPEILTRRKVGFSMPVRRWAGAHPDLFAGAVGRLADRGILRRRRLPRLNNEQTWSLLILDSWLRQTGAL